MKTLLLSLIILLSAINPMFGMEDGEQRARVRCGEVELGEAALSAIANHLHAGNTHLVRSIAREWFEQHPNGTYREFLDEYTQRRSLPVRLMRAVWREVMRARLQNSQLGIAAKITKIINREKPELELHESNPLGQAIYFNLNLDAGLLGYGCYTNSGYNSADRLRHEDGVINSVLSCAYASDNSQQSHSSRGILNTVGSFLLHPVNSLFGYTDSPMLQDLPMFCVVTVSLTEQSRPFVIAQKLNTFVQAARQYKFCLLIRLISKVTHNNVSHIIVHDGLIIAVPSDVVPAGASDGQVQQAITYALDHQPIFSSIQEAIQYLEGLGL